MVFRKFFHFCCKNRWPPLGFYEFSRNNPWFPQVFQFFLQQCMVSHKFFRFSCKNQWFSVSFSTFPAEFPTFFPVFPQQSISVSFFYFPCKNRQFSVGFSIFPGVATRSCYSQNENNKLPCLFFFFSVGCNKLALTGPAAQDFALFDMQLPLVWAQ